MATQKASWVMLYPWHKTDSNESLVMGESLRDRVAGHLVCYRAQLFAFVWLGA